MAGRELSPNITISHSMSDYQMMFYTLAAFVFLFGACVGSFLNVYIHRIPRGMSVGEPKRSFCPHCEEPIPVYRNIPLVTWLIQRGKSACCGKPIAPRYFFVELATALLFLGVWLQIGHGLDHERVASMVFPPQYLLALPFFFMMAMLVAGTFIDIEHYIIPDLGTVGLVVAGLASAFLYPPFMGVGEHSWGVLFYGFDQRIEALGWASFGACLGFVLLFMVAEGGKLVFGRKRMVLEKAEIFTWVRDGQDATLQVGQEEPDVWSGIFGRPSDRLILICEDLEIDGKAYPEKKVRFSWEKLYFDGAELKLDDLDKITGKVREIIIPREAMGFGDVKLLAGIGALLGWKAVLFSIFAASVLGTALTLGAIAVGRRSFSQKLPFGPYLAAGAVLWFFLGESVLAWYFEIFLQPVEVNAEYYISP